MRCGALCRSRTELVGARSEIETGRAKRPRGRTVVSAHASCSCSSKTAFRFHGVLQAASVWRSVIRSADRLRVLGAVVQRQGTGLPRFGGHEEGDRPSRLCRVRVVKGRRPGGQRHRAVEVPKGGGLVSKRDGRGPSCSMFTRRSRWAMPRRSVSISAATASSTTSRQRICKVPNSPELTPIDGKIEIRGLVDRPMLEIVGNRGRVYITLPRAKPGTSPTFASSPSVAQLNS